MVNTAMDSMASRVTANMVSMETMAHMVMMATRN